MSTSNYEQPYEHLFVKCKFAHEIVRSTDYTLYFPERKNFIETRSLFNHGPKPTETYEDFLIGKIVIVKVKHGKKNCIKDCEKNKGLGLDKFKAIVNKCEIKEINVNSLLYNCYSKKEASELNGIPYRTDCMLIETIREIKEELIKLREDSKYKPIYEKDKCNVCNISYESGSANYCHVLSDDDEVEDENISQEIFSQIN